MTTSGTYNYNPSLGELTLYAFNLAEIRNTAIAQEHMESARMASNMLLANWSNRGVNLWTVDLQQVYFDQTPAILTVTGNGTTTTLTYATPNTPIYTAGTQITIYNTGVVDGTQTVTSSVSGAVSFESSYNGTSTPSNATIAPYNQFGIQTSISTYSVDPNTVVILDAYVTTTSNESNPIDRIILPVSRTEYASYPNKQQQGFPTVFWFDRLISSSRSSGSPGPSVTLWPVPDGQSSQYLKYYRVRQIQDSNFTSGQTVEIPYLWMEAYAYALAHRLAVMWNPQKSMLLKPLADETYAIAADQNVETSNVYISPQISGYFR
jgi:hypothetical protein